MKAVVVDPEAPGRLVIQEVGEPRPAPAEAVVRVGATSLNRGEVRRAMAAPAGHRPGWDLAGTVEQAAADGSGPPPGARVVGHLGAGSWAQRAAVPTSALAQVPGDVSLAQAATLPVAGLTALYMLDKRGALAERRVLVTGASGGVGTFAIQLAHLGGARVVGVVRRPDRATLVKDLGADVAVVSEDAGAAAAHGPYDLILDAVGGQVLGNVLGMLGPGGVCMSFGVTGGSEATFDASRFFRVGGASLQAFMLFRELAVEPASIGLPRLLRLVAQGRLKPLIEVETSWTKIGDVAQQLLDREFAGKAVLHID